MKLIHYHQSSSTHPDFKLNVRKLLNELPRKDRVLTLHIFAGTDESHYREYREIMLATAGEIFEQVPLCTLVMQSPQQPNTLIAETAYLHESIPLNSIHFHTSAAGRYATLENSDYSVLITEGLMADDLNHTMAMQSKEVFEKLQDILKHTHMPMKQIVRQWNYIGHITELENGCQNYQEFNNARAAAYASCSWELGYPAATGISMSLHAVIISIIAIQTHNDTTIFPLDNSLQLAAHRYSEQVLLHSAIKQTPKFERAKIVQHQNHATCFISGTAAILGEESRYKNDAAAQTIQTIALLRHLISDNNLSKNGIHLHKALRLNKLRVYVKHPTDFAMIQNAMISELPDVDAFYVCAPVCRDELLVEIEGIAINY